jgi:hypothetical protein
MRSRRGLGVLAVCGLVLGMMAISASGAQAGMWMVNKANVGSGVELKVEVGVGIEGPGVTLLSTSGATKVAITCTKARNTVGVVTLETITGTVNFEGCTTKINEKEEKNCTPLGQPIKAGGTVKAVLHFFEPYARMTGKEVIVEKKVISELAIIKFNEETCVALPPAVKVTGTGWIKDFTPFEFETEQATHLLSEGKIPAEILGGLFFGSSEAKIDGSANVSFADAAHSKMTFSGLAE